MKKSQIIELLSKLELKVAYDEPDNLSDTQERFISSLRAFKNKFIELDKLYQNKPLSDNQYDQDLRTLQSCLHQLSNLEDFFDSDETGYTYKVTEIYEKLLNLNINK